MKRSRAVALLAALSALPAERRRAALAVLPAAAVAAIADEWWWRAHGGQHEPWFAPGGGHWRVWAIVAGRGFGKTRAGAEWVWARARENPEARIALVAATLDEAARVMVEGESGLLAAARTGEAARWIPSRRTLLFPSGARAFVYSAARPESLRGPQHHFAWCDELAKWPPAPAAGAGAGGEAGAARGEAAWDNLMLGLRLGERPRVLLTTTPRPVPLLRRILALPGTAATHGRTADNPHLPADFRDAMESLYAGTRLGRQELDAELFDDVPGALWTPGMLEAGRIAAPPRPALVRVVVGVDPPASAHGDSCGIVVCGLDREGASFVLDDLTVSGLRPEGWARRVAAAAAMWDAQRVVAEKNQGGDMVESVLRAAALDLPVRLVAATLGKAARAEPVALRFETGRARLAGRFPALEEQLCGMTVRGYEGPGASPDRADAMVWAMTDLFAPHRADPRIYLL
jgi:phage terminase large subunit-like protein